MSTSREKSPKAGFADLGLSAALVASVTSLGYEEPTPVQSETIPILLGRHDLLAMAATGTGKTAAFALPMLQRLSEPEPESPDPREAEQSAKDLKRRAAGIIEERPRLVAKKRRPSGGQTGGVVLVPTRELAMQVAEAVHKYANGTGLSVVPLYGGASMEQQIRALARGVDIVVATPGRALDHLRRQTLSLEGVRMLVLDEADEMLDMGFAEDIETILQATPATRQTALFSATLPARILRIAEKHLRSPRKVQIAGEKTAAGKMPRIRQVAYIVRRDQKPAALDRILDMESPDTAIVFCRTRIEVDTLVEALSSHGYRAEALHGGMMQRQRDAVMGRVRSGKTDLLIATDVAARGLDIESVSHVVNFDLPSDPDSYVHRIGRTGRAGRAGTAITLVDPREHRHLRTIERMTRQTIEIAQVPTVSDLKRRRLEQTAVALREQLTSGGFEQARALVTELASEFDVIDIAAAAIALAEAASGGTDDEVEFTASAPSWGAQSGARSGGQSGTSSEARSAPRGRPQQGPEGSKARIFFGAGKKAGIRPADLVGAIAGEAQVPSNLIGPIQITESFSVVDVPEELAEKVIAAVGAGGLRGKKVTVRRDRHA